MRIFILTLITLSLYGQSPVAIPAKLSHGVIAPCSQKSWIELVAVAQDGESYLLEAYPNCAISRFDLHVKQNAAIKNAPTYHVVSADGFNGLSATLHPISGCKAPHSNEPDKCKYLKSNANEAITIYLHKNVK